MTEKLSSRSQKIFTRGVADGRLLAVRNWRHRMSVDDAIIAVPLTKKQLATYKRNKKDGRSDEAIFNELFPSSESAKIALSIDELTKAQLLTLIERVLEQSLPTLARMSRSDLTQMLRSLCQQKSQTRAYLV